MGKRYFRRAKGDTCFPHDAKAASEEEEEEEVVNNQETTLLISEEKRTAKPSQSGASGANLADRGGGNPFVGTGTSARTTVYVIDVSGSMQTSVLHSLC